MYIGTLCAVKCFSWTAKSNHNVGCLTSSRNSHFYYSLTMTGMFEIRLSKFTVYPNHWQQLFQVAGELHWLSKSRAYPKQAPSCTTA